MKYVWCIVVAVLCFFLIFGVIVYCMNALGSDSKHQGGVLVENSVNAVNVEYGLLENAEEMFGERF